MRALALLLLLTVSVHAQTAAPTATLTPAQAQSVLETLQDDKKRAAFITVLQDITRALPAAPAEKAVVQIAPNSLGARLLLQVSRQVAVLTTQFATAVDAVNETPLLLIWAEGVVQDEQTRSRVLAALWRLAVVVAGALLAEWLLARALARPLRALQARAPADDQQPLEASDADAPGRQRRFSVAWKMLRRLPLVLVALAMNLLPVAGFAAVGNLLLSTKLGETANARLVILAVVNAYVICRTVMCTTRMLVAPRLPRLRLVQCTDETAAYLERWVRRLAIVAVFGFAVAEVALLFGLYDAAHDLLLKLVSLVVHVMLIIVVLQKRHAVERRLRARHGARGTMAILQNQLAARWHLAAIFYIVALWLVAAAEIRDGYTRLLHFALVTTAVLIAARLAAIVLLGGLDRLLHALGQSTPALEPRLARYDPALRASVSTIVFAATLLALLEVWGFSAVDWFSPGKLGGQALSAVLTSAMTVGLAAVVWEVANASVENHLAGLTRQAQNARAARLRTLLPLLRTTLMVTILIIAGLIVLSQVGVNIAPLLAGAGVLGVAIGFGSQKLVQDLITGLFLLLENTMQVGDVVTLGGQTGTVETLSIRTIRLRALDGSVHIIPFSSVSTVTNQTRDFSYALVDLQVGLDEEPDRVAGVLRELVATMREEPRWQDAITADLEVMGVHAFDANAWVLRIRIRTTPSQRWAVNREFNRRVKYRFDELAIQSPLTAWRVQGWLAPGSERPMPHPLPPSLPPALPIDPEPASP